MTLADLVYIEEGLAVNRPAPGAVPGKRRGWFSTDTGVLSITDGVSWVDIGGPGVGGAVDSVFGRTGAVAAATSDYDADQVDFTPAGTISATDVQAAIEEVAAEAGGSIDVTDGSTTVSPATSLDFTSGATVTDGGGGIAQVAIGGGGFAVAVETPTGTVDGSNDTFTLSAAPDPPEDLLLWKSGLFQEQGVDYTLTTDTIVFAVPPATGSVLQAGMPAAGGGSSPYLPTADEKDALDNANAPDASNPFATMADVGGMELVYRYTVTGSDKASIDTGVDTPDAGSNDWTNGDLLEIFEYTRTDDAAATATISIILNNDASSIYDRVRVTDVNATVSGANVLANASYDLTTLGSTAAAGAFGSGFLYIPNYAGTVGWKAGLFQDMLINTLAASTRTDANGFQYRSTSAITRLKLFCAGTAKLKVGSQLLIYKRLAS